MAGVPGSLKKLLLGRLRPLRKTKKLLLGAGNPVFLMPIYKLYYIHTYSLRELHHMDVLYETA